ncbi:MAG: guanylate kinase [candidate division Zixibacteria bacterium RBG_16_40_9]|nr:MAG: guanylate kinase [candidate division Zixibacteria bacterium RBG_16_40_9]
MKNFNKKPLLVVLSSPSGGGKTSICRQVVKTIRNASHSVSVTTRLPRKNEAEGKDYFFVTEKKFKELIRRKQLVEWAKVFGKYYGTLKKSVKKASGKNLTMFFTLDPQGALAIKRKYPSSVLIYVLPPSLSELEQRLQKRKTDSSQIIKHRLRAALKEITFGNKYDYLIVNQDLKESVNIVKSIIQAEKNKSRNFNFKSWSKFQKL